MERLLIDSFVIPLPPITKKNSQRILTNRTTGKPFVMPSEQYKQYERDASLFIPRRLIEEKNLNVRAYFYMPTRRRVDATNLMESLDDILVCSGYLPDDNSSIIAGHDGTRVRYDKDNPRTEVYIEQMSSEEL